ncbi:MAG: ribosome maturation factor RimP [Syntrophaceae bacterium]|nr:ribosome maturation factor RimP [Syntrophaceae bacterium]
MMSNEIEERVRAVIAPILLQEALDLVDIEYRRESKGWVLRLTLDKEGGVTLDDCARVSHEVGRNLDIEDFIQVPYTLEVSSPGLTRPLKTEKDFIKYFHRLIKVKTLSPIENRRIFKGKLLGLFENKIKIESDDGIFEIPLEKVAKANLELDQEMVKRKVRGNQPPI